MLAELERISERGGVLGAMETGYQRGRIQDESMLYEHRKHDGSLPIVGVNTFLAAPAAPTRPAVIGAAPLRRRREAGPAPAPPRLPGPPRRRRDRPPSSALRRAALDGTNTFDALMDAVRHCTLGEITAALFEVGGKYRRNV